MPFITKQFKFCAAHKYWNDNWTENKNIEIFEDDVRVHGHNYELDITLSGHIDDESGFAVNISKLKHVVNKYVIDVLDHTEIQKDIEWFSGKQPSTENLVLFIWEQIVNRIPDDAKLYKIKLRETPTIYTEYFGPHMEIR
tara:strand:- start:66 stop:485 length:420 start_codon:yes stop_codon:yes gene_type:complete